MLSSGCPGCGQIGPCALRPLTSISMMSPVLRPCLSASFGLIRTALSQHRFDDRLGRFLKPRIVGAAAVVDQGIAPEDHFHQRRCRRRCSADAGTAPALARHVLRRHAVFAATNPSCTALRQAVSKSPLHLPLPVLADDVVARGFGGANQRENKLVLALAVVQRRDQWLNDARRSVEGPRVSPFSR